MRQPDVRCKEMIFCLIAGNELNPSDPPQEFVISVLRGQICEYAPTSGTQTLNLCCSETEPRFSVIVTDVTPVNLCFYAFMLLRGRKFSR